MGVAISVFGKEWGPSVHVIRTEPDGTQEKYTNSNRPRANQSMTAGLRELGTHIFKVSSASNDCAATLVFDVVGAGL